MATKLASASPFARERLHSQACPCEGRDGTHSDCHSSEGWNPAVTDMYYVYVMASRRNGTPYIGVTNSLIERVYEHKDDLYDELAELLDSSLRWNDK